MANAFVQLQPDGAGKKVQTFENTISAQVVEAQAFCLVDAVGLALVTAPVDAAALTSTLYAAQALYNGATLDRQRSVAGDAMAITGVAAVAEMLWNSASLDRSKSASAANLAALSGAGARLSTPPGMWSVNAQATAGTASVVKAAGGAGVRHVCTALEISIAAGATVQTPLIFNLRDGASGAGTILRTWALSAPVNSGQSICLSGLNIPGSAATAMTLEAAGASAAAVVASVNLSGYDTV